MCTQAWLVSNVVWIHKQCKILHWGKTALQSVAENTLLWSFKMYICTPVVIANLPKTTKRSNLFLFNFIPDLTSGYYEIVSQLLYWMIMNCREPKKTASCKYAVSNYRKPSQTNQTKSSRTNQNLPTRHEPFSKKIHRKESLIILPRYFAIATSALRFVICRLR